MTLRQLTYVLAVADTGSFTEAARRMHVSQPSLSQQIRALEEELGGRLLDRPPRPVRLTAAGRAFVAEARAAVTGARRAADAARATLEHGVGELRVATVRSLAVSQLPAAIRRWRTTHPGMTVHLNEYAHRELAGRSVLEGESDLGIAPRPLAWTGPVEGLGWDQFVVVLPRSDPLLASPQVDLRLLAARDWVLFEPGHGLAELAGWVFDRAGFEPSGVAYTAQVEAAARLAAAGVGPALVPGKTVPAEFVENARPLDPPVVWEVSAFAAGEGWTPQNAELVASLRGAGWDRQRPKGSVQIKLEGASSLAAAQPAAL
jgi:DNA-binding transcriptional LysR family regulator